MDAISNKAIVIAVSVFITIMISSGVFMVFDQIKNVYLQVYNTNISISSEFSEFDAYDNTKKTRVEVLNAAKKYRNKEKIVEVYFQGSRINNDAWIAGFKFQNFDEKNNQKTPNDLYTATVDRVSRPIKIYIQ